MCVLIWALKLEKHKNVIKLKKKEITWSTFDSSKNI